MVNNQTNNYNEISNDLYILQADNSSKLSEKSLIDLRECLCRPGSSIATGRPGQTLYCFVDDDRCRGKCLNCKCQACLPKDPLANTVKVGCASIMQ